MVEETAGEEIFKFRLTSVGEFKQGISVWTRVKILVDEPLSLGWHQEDIVSSHIKGIIRSLVNESLSLDWHQVIQISSILFKVLFKLKLLLDEPFRLATSRLVFFNYYSRVLFSFYLC